MYFSPRSSLMRLVGAFAILGAASGCTGTGNSEDAGDFAMNAVPPQNPLPNEPLYAGLPTGPNNTGTYPSFADQPQARIIDNDPADAQQIIARLEALEAAQKAGTVSPAAYKRRLAALKRLAATHSPAMLRRIEAGS